MEEKIELELGSFKLLMPSYMLCLKEEYIQEIIETKKGLDKKIVAAGVHPKDGKVTLLTASAGLYSFDPRVYYIPQGLFVPTRNGIEVFLPNLEERWPPQIDGFKILSSWLLEVSEPLTTSASLHVLNNYLCELQFDSSKITDT